MVDKGRPGRFGILLLIGLTFGLIYFVFIDHPREWWGNFRDWLSEMRKSWRDSE